MNGKWNGSCASSVKLCSSVCVCHSLQYSAEEQKCHWHVEQWAKTSENEYWTPKMNIGHRS